MTTRATMQFDSERFSLIGPNWTARLNTWSKIPVNCHVLLDVEVEHEGQDLVMQAHCFLDSNKTLYHDAQEWRLAPRSH